MKGDFLSPAVRYLEKGPFLLGGQRERKNSRKQLNLPPLLYQIRVLAGGYRLGLCNRLLFIRIYKNIKKLVTTECIGQVFLCSR
jgi:hypothetical protein